MKSTPLSRWMASALPLAAWLCLASPSYSQDSGGSSTDAALPNAVSLGERKLNVEANKELKDIWSARGKAEEAPPPLVRSPKVNLLSNGRFNVQALGAQDSALPLSQRLSMVLKADAEFQNPDEIKADASGVLNARLDANYAYNYIGSDLVHLRNYNGKLVGPTLRVKPGNKIKILLRNQLPAERWRPDMMNTLNSFNTTNIHYHGLHVSPNGISDNVLINVGPHQTQEYELDIDKDHTTGTYWYHPHRHGSTAGNVASGMSGALIIEGGLDDIPEIKAAKERIMVLNQIPYVMEDIKNPSKATGKATKQGIIEEHTANKAFAPGAWVKLGRYTTINGIALPVIRMRPGQVERWRLIDSGLRETIRARLVPSPATPTTVVLPPMPLNEIAVDGLALGEMIPKDFIELWPGYRSDVLVKAPAVKGEYILVDDSIPSTSTISGTDKPMNYLARIIIDGEPMDMKLPTKDQMKDLRLPSIKNGEITGQQTAKYGIITAGNGIAFTIDRKTFDMESARTLYRDDVDEWTLTSVNDVALGFVTHPFHIHVNPFEVTSILAPALDSEGNPIIKNGGYVMAEQLTNGPVWRDTVKIPGNGTVKMRTRYTKFIGTFVQHCHILDHEDLGMMQLIDIRDPADKKLAKAAAAAADVAKTSTTPGAVAPALTLPDADGKEHSLTDLQGKPVALFFFKGHGCLHCVEQLSAFVASYQAFQAKGIEVIGVSTDEVTTLKEALGNFPCPFTLLSDPKGEAFARYGCVNLSGLQHGTFVLNADHRMVWGTAGGMPYMGINTLIDMLSSSTPVRTASEPASIGKETRSAALPVSGNALAKQ